jgi:DNA-binding NtrC family response regulator
VGGTQTVKVDVRIVAATNRDLAAEVKAGRFREDLYYRLNVVAVTLPSLRQRKGDIPDLASHFIQKYSAAYNKSIKGLAPGTLNALLNHSWPGNVRELEKRLSARPSCARWKWWTASPRARPRSSASVFEQFSIGSKSTPAASQKKKLAHRVKTTSKAAQRMRSGNLKRRSATSCYSPHVVEGRDWSSSVNSLAPPRSGRCAFTL